MNTRGCTPSTPTIRRVNTSQLRTRENLIIRPTTSRSLEDCVIKDSAHYGRKLRMKITQVKAELFEMKEKINGLNADNKRMEYRARQAQNQAKVLTELQDLLSDHLFAIVEARMGIKISEIVKETASLKANNNSVTMEQEELYALRLDEKQRVERLKKEISDVIESTALRDAQQAVRNDPMKAAQVRMELQLWELSQKRDFLAKHARADDKASSCGSRIEKEIDFLHVVLDNVLTGMSASIRDVSNLREYEKTILENHLQRFQNCSPRQLLNYLVSYLSQLKTMEKFITRAVEQVSAKSMDLEGICVNALNVSSLSDDLERVVTNLKTEKSLVECQLQTSTDRLNVRATEMQESERLLEDNEQYRIQRELENKLRHLKEQNYSIREYLEEGKSLNDLHKHKERTLSLINSLNAKIISKLNE